MAQGINKAIPPNTMEFPDYEYKEYPKIVGREPNAPDGTKGKTIVVNSKAEEAVYKDQKAKDDAEKKAQAEAAVKKAEEAVKAEQAKDDEIAALKAQIADMQQAQNTPQRSSQPMSGQRR